MLIPRSATGGVFCRLRRGEDEAGDDGLGVGEGDVEVIEAGRIVLTGGHAGVAAVVGVRFGDEESVPSVPVPLVDGE